MKTHNKMMIAMGAFALTATTLLAGCGGSSTASTPAAEPAAASSPAAEPAAAESAAASSPAAEVPTSVADGLVRPAGVSDDSWAEFTAPLAHMDDAFKDVPPEDAAEFCARDKEEMRASYGVDDSDVAGYVAADGGTDEEWSAVFAKWLDNIQRIACSMAK